MNSGDGAPAYGHGSGPQDGQIKPIPVPAPPQDQRTEAEQMLLAKRAIRRKNLNGIAAMSGGLATIAFFIIGFALHGWAWGWIVFLIPPMIHRYLANSE